MNIKPLFRFMMFVMLGMSLYSAQPYNDYESFLKDFKSIGYDIKQAKKIQSFILPLNYAEIFMEDGVYYPLTALNGRTYGGLFVGEGNFEFNIPNKAEKCQLKRFYQREAINSPIEWVLVFSASDLHNQIIQSGEDFKTSKEPTNTPLEVLKFANLTINKNIILGDISKAILNSENNNYSYHVIKCKDIDDPLIYEYSPNLIEPILLHRAMPNTFGYYSEPINQFYALGTDGKLITPNCNSNYLHPLKYNIYLDFYDFNPKINTNVHLKVLKETGKWIVSNLYTRCVIDEIKLNGEKLQYYSNNYYSILFIKLPKSFSAGDTFSLDMKYGSEKGAQLMYAGGSWYPTFGYDMKSVFDVKAKYSGSKTIFKTVGDEIETKELDGDYISHWVTPIPVLRSAFFIAPMTESKATSTTGIDLNILHYHLSDRKSIIEHIDKSLELFTQLYGTLDNKKINVRVNSETEFFPYYGYCQMHGEFLYGDRVADGAREIAKLWWAEQLNIGLYRDGWLCLGFSSFSELLYLQLIKKDIDTYQRKLKQYAKTLYTLYNSTATEGKTAGIISIGYRNHENPDDVVNIKSVWFLHMLRNMVIDLNTMNEDIFVSILRDFFKTNKGKIVTTQDFLDCVERNTKFDFTWFFDQWLNTNDIPKYSYAYKTEKIDGKYITKFKVKQENVPADFKMLVPVALVDDNKIVTATRAYITGDKVIEFALAPTDLEPDEVVFNYLNSVLCELDEIGWDSF